MLSAARKLKEKLNQEISGVLLGKNVKDKAEQFIKRETDKVYLIDDECQS